MSAPPDPIELRPGGADEAATLVGYLAFLRSQVTTAVLSLDPVVQRRSRLPSGWSPLELLSHLLHMERRWFLWGFGAEPVGRPWGDLDVDDPDAVGGARWHVPDDVDAAGLVARLDEVAAATEVVLSSTPLEQRARTGGRFADEQDAPTLRAIAFHVLHEYARHAGHLDIAVELAEGT
ncbi:mycothiol transferase [Auraticoccus monumenti]|uniref:DinB superfamily protein n=1 Tax=Auraticoccus monumenti TaxID=675864 RepID=A0A1G6XWR9_9ACTN|nr:DUF664 domain-containing protein [Auraticoccus monumenti]SDD82560.1 Protein of unknown function [Auraticoccus monumenti]